MGKMPGRGLNKRIQRKPLPGRRTAPDSGKPVALLKPSKPSTGSTPHTQHTHRSAPTHHSVLKVIDRMTLLVKAIWRKVMPPKTAAPGRYNRSVAKRRRLVICVGSAAVVIAVALLVLLAPGGSAASASDTPSASAAASPVFTPVPTTAADTGTAIPTTAPDTVATPSPTPKPTATPKPTVKPTATPKPTAKPTATPKPTAKPTAAPTVAPTAAPSSSSSDTDSLVAFYVETADTYYDKVGYSTNHYDYTDDELLVLARIMQIEAGSTNGMIAVGNVIMNRVLCGRFGSTITAVVTAPNQFAYNASVTPKQSAISAAHSVLDDEVWLVPQNTYYFKGSGTEGVAWGSNPYCATIGGNYFYTHNYSGRYNGSSIPEALFARTYQYAQYGCKPAERVYRIQYMLKSLGYDTATDKYFGKGTKAALIQFQQANGLEADGVAGPATLRALINAFGADAYSATFG